MYTMDFTGTHHLPGDDVTALIVQSDTVWVTLRDAGLVAIVHDSVIHFRAPDHIPTDLLGVTLDHGGNVCTSDQSLVRFSPKNGRILDPGERWIRI